MTDAIASGLIGALTGAVAGGVLSYLVARSMQNRVAQQSSDIDAIAQTRSNLMAEITWLYWKAKGSGVPSDVKFGLATYPRARRGLIGDSAVAREYLAVWQEIFLDRGSSSASLTADEEGRITALLPRINAALDDQMKRVIAGGRPETCDWEAVAKGLRVGPLPGD